ncbi:MAG: DUF1800 family protein [Akkermansiaceae bacterium]
MITPRSKRGLRMTALCFGLVIGASPLLADPPEITLNGSDAKISLPDAAGGQSFRVLERSEDFFNWEPVARDYGNGWENIFPFTLPVSPTGPGQILTDAINVDRRFYRVGQSSGTSLTNEHAASRFLQQATFGPTRTMISSFPGVGSLSGFNDPPYTFYQQWIDAEIAKSPTLLRVFWRERSDPSYVQGADPYEVAHNATHGQQFSYYVGTVANQTPNNEITPTHSKEAIWHHAAMTADDALRQRAAWAISQTFVVSTVGMTQTDIGESWLKYYDIFLRHTFGNFRDIVEEVTYSPLMGYYLSYQGNAKANLSAGTFPDENYAREIMQLFTIGLWLLNQDGTPALDGNGNPVPTYDNDDIFEIAKIFTGLRLETTRTNIEIRGTSNRIDPMRTHIWRHDFTTKTLLDYDGPEGPLTRPTIVAATQDDAGLRQEIGSFLDHLFNHPNTPPFLARNLIQRMTASNPSPNYIKAVADAFTHGHYNGVGSMARGDMSAVFRAILLHPEAREVTLSGDTAHGKLREPLIRLLSYARAFEIAPHSDPLENPYGIVAFKNIANETAQQPFKSPSVFNYYLPSFQPTGSILDRNLFAPEFQIHNDVTALSLQNAIRELTLSGIGLILGTHKLKSNLDLTHEISLAEDTVAGHDALLDHLELMLTPGRLSVTNRATLFTAIDTINGDTPEQREDRVEMALQLFGLLPEFNIIQ